MWSMGTETRGGNFRLWKRKRLIYMLSNFLLCRQWWSENSLMRWVIIIPCEAQAQCVRSAKAILSKLGMDYTLPQLLINFTSFKRIPSNLSLGTMKPFADPFLNDVDERGQLLMSELIHGLHLIVPVSIFSSNLSRMPLIKRGYLVVFCVVKWMNNTE